MINRNKFIFVEYNGVTYPDGFTTNIKEIAAHLDKNNIEFAEKYSLHTEYSYGKRKFDTALISNFTELKSAQKDGVPQLWKTGKWAEQFAEKNGVAKTMVALGHGEDRKDLEDTYLNSKK